MILGAIILVAGEARALEPGDVDMTVDPGIAREANNRTDRPGWVPVKIKLKNRGASFNAELVVKNGSGNYTVKKDISLQAGDERIYWVYLQAGVASGDDELTAELWLSGVDAEKAFKSSRRSIGFDGGARGGYYFNILHFKSVKDRDGAYQPIKNRSLDTSYNNDVYPCVREFGADERIELPDRIAGYNSIDLVVFNEFNFDRLEPAAEEALAGWVRAGGSVLLSPRSTGWLKNRFVEKLLDLDKYRITAKKVRSIPNLEARTANLYFDDKEREKNEIRLIYLESRNKDEDNPDVDDIDYHIIEHIGRERNMDFPVLYSLRAGFGRVYFLSFDMGKKPFNGWNGSLKMWREIYSALRFTNQGGEGALQSNARGTRSVWSSMCEAIEGKINKMPSLALISILIMAYLVLVGPINYYIVSRKNRQILVVATIPVMVVIYVGVVFITGYLFKGVDTVAQKLERVELINGKGFARTNAFFSVFSASASRYDVGTDAKSRLTGLYKKEEGFAGADLQVRQDRGAFSVESHFINMWGLQFFAAASERELQPPPGKEKLVPGITVGFDERGCYVLNATGLSISEGVVMVSRPGESAQFCSSGPIEPGIKVYPEVKKSVTDPYELKTALLENEDPEKRYDSNVLELLETGGACFIGTLKDGVTGFFVDSPFKVDRELSLVVVRRAPERRSRR